MTDTERDFTNPFDSPEVDEFLAQLNAESRLQPGDEGWWQVWGSSVGDICPGDIVLTRNGEDYEALFIEDRFEAKSVARLGIIVGGQQQTLGRLTGIVLMRRGTKHTLSNSAR